MRDIASEPAPAKVNLALHVVGQREDGFHLLHMLCVFTELADLVSAQPAETDALTVSGPFGPDLPIGRSNLVWRALEKFRARFPDHLPAGLAIHLEKHLPVASGLGGGSADAAAVLRLLGRISTQPVADGDLFALAATLGSDVPMCLLSQTCEVSGVGEQILPLQTFPRLYLVLVNPLEQVSTPNVFRALLHKQNDPMPPVPEPFDRAALVSLWLSDTRNDLETPAKALVPAIGPVIAAIGATSGCVVARMSGAGATCFGLYGSAGAAHQAAHDLREHFPTYWIAATPILTSA
ncbi:MAG TPA: 4-(cytidine 5'-diphospho)-2-C-methyl-D-erythritol kinase [Pelagibacterium sp.]|uniref:4-(cytidine 5'-diphospho)-2-C-methyl-D-erythritol kinase n=1 Tax=Pelagibacterium sp. TaxID=1967288 RepID=UPI002B93D174|nr:4-(cytidine 5'-diphospho)-2-C-methyl-D-erythritol kinase [Pelagibacterium sp.]HWJ89235.1 4-(cytidine 5'-diphospho)-2-C-methyl-D-erythritol kinase [Pelagibacterium sp.]